MTVTVSDIAASRVYSVIADICTYELLSNQQLADLLLHSVAVVNKRFSLSAKMVLQ